MPGLGDRLQGGPPPDEPGLGDRLLNQWKTSLANRILSAPSKLFGGLVVDPAVEGVTDLVTLAGDVYGGRQPTMSADPRTGEMHTDPRLSERAMNAAGTMTLGAGAVPAEANSLRMGIKAYHGSPHDFERFDSSKIGTGEGAQAYGSGLYFAEREGVATDYRNKLGGGRTEITNPATQTRETLDYDRWHDTLPDLVKAVDPKINPQTTAQKIKNAVVDAKNADVPVLQAFDEAAAKKIEGLQRNKNPDHIIEYERQANTRIRSVLEQLNPQHKNVGKMYEVDIAADPEHFLDWDKPLSEQSPQVRRGYTQAVAGGDPIASELLDESPESLRMAGLFPRSSGAQAYNTLAQSKRDIWRKQNASPQDVPSSRQIGEWAQEASEQLREAGIPGIKYLDQGSRAKGSVLAADGKPTGYHNIDQELANVHGGSWEAFKAAHPNPSPQLKAAIDDLDARGGVVFNREKGTSNYVVFPGNEHLIAILKKYGLPISAAGLAALSQLHPEEARAGGLGDRLQSE